jgi:hypothetical protein
MRFSSACGLTSMLELKRKDVVLLRNSSVKAGWPVKQLWLVRAVPLELTPPLL